MLWIQRQIQDFSLCFVFLTMPIPKSLWEWLKVRKHKFGWFYGIVFSAANFTASAWTIKRKLIRVSIIINLDIERCAIFLLREYRIYNSYNICTFELCTSRDHWPRSNMGRQLNVFLIRHRPTTHIYVWNVWARAKNRRALLAFD